MKKYLISILVISHLTGCFIREPEKTGKEGKLIPEFNLLLLDSTTSLNISHSKAHTPIVLFYFSPMCPYCKMQTEEVIKNMDKLKNIQFYFTSAFPIPMLKAYTKEYKLAQYPNITIGRDTANSIGNYFEIAGVPYMAIYGKDKKLKKSFMGGKLNSSQIKKITEE
jgi:thiol-disulfide isomerase/thioredoxin